MKIKLPVLLVFILTIIIAKAQTPITVGSYISVAGQADAQRNNSIFSYTGAGTPWNGALLTVGGFNTGSYPLQINADYGPNGGNHLSFRTRMDDAGAHWNSWYEIYHLGNLNRSDVDFTAKNLFINGNVGIGTATPKVKLCLQGNKSISLNPDRTVVSGIRAGTSLSYSGNFTLFTEDGIAGEGIDINYWNGSIYYQAIRINNVTTGYGNLLMMQDGGNVLIGKTSQTNTAYKLDVSGKVRADEITVNTTGADFVFEPKYKLLTLTEVEAFIKANKHLPDIAPATDMQTNGISMGEMQTKLLQKVEELTLYTIEQDKKIKEQDKKLQEQQQTNAMLQQEINELKQLFVEKVTTK